MTKRPTGVFCRPRGQGSRPRYYRGLPSHATEGWDLEPPETLDRGQTPCTAALDSFQPVGAGNTEEKGPVVGVWESAQGFPGPVIPAGQPRGAGADQDIRELQPLE